MAAAYYQKFQVTGTGSFPIDMLRYDQCFPSTQEDVDSINTPEYWPGHDKSARTVTLARITCGKPVAPTMGRWESFGWKVNASTVRTRKIES